MRTKLYKAALLTVLGLSSMAASAQSTTDLLLGFNDNNSGIPGAENDYVIDLGLNAATLVADANANSGTYNLSSLFNPTIFNTAFGADTNALNHVDAGVVGGFTGSNPKLLYQTVAVNVTPSVLTSGGMINTAANAAQGVAIGEYGSSASSGWTALVSYNEAVGGNTPSGSSVSGTTGTSAVGLLSSGILSMNLWENQRNSSFGPAIGWVEEGSFNINLNTGSVMFSVTPAPEPSTCSLLGGAGLLVLLFRRKIINHKNT